MKTNYLKRYTISSYVLVWLLIIFAAGFTGLNMERPDLQRMLRAIERRQINLVITKDLSRLGRNYLQTGHLIEDFLGNILAVHLVQDILERGNIVVITQGVDTVIHGDIADTVSWEKVLNQMPGLQIVTPQSAEVFRDDKVDLPALNGSQHSL